MGVISTRPSVHSAFSGLFCAVSSIIDQAMQSNLCHFILQPNKRKCYVFCVKQQFPFGRDRCPVSAKRQQSKLKTVHYVWSEYRQRTTQEEKMPCLIIRVKIDLFTSFRILQPFPFIHRISKKNRVKRSSEGC